MATQTPIIKYGEFFHISMLYISANNEHSSFEIYTSHAWEHGECTQIKLSLNVKVEIQHIKTNMKIILGAITFEPEVVETSGWLQIIP